MNNQTIVAHNTYEAEFIALSHGRRQLHKVRNYSDGCGYELAPTPLYEANTSVVRYAREIGLAPPAQPLNQHLHYTRKQQQNGIIDIRSKRVIKTG